MNVRETRRQCDKGPFVLDVRTWRGAISLTVRAMSALCFLLFVRWQSQYFVWAFIGTIVVQAALFFWRDTSSENEGGIWRSRAGDKRDSEGERGVWSLSWRFLVGVAYLTMVTFVVTPYMRLPLPHTFLIMAGLAFVCCSLGLTWLTLWAQRGQRSGQFALASLFFLTVYPALFLSIVRLVALGMNAEGYEYVDALQRSASLCLLLSIAAIPFMAWLTESLLWTAVYLIRRLRAGQRLK